MEDPARMPPQPVLDLGVLVATASISLPDLHAPPPDRGAFVYVECGEQRGGARAAFSRASWWRSDQVSAPPATLAIARPVQCVPWCGGSAQVSATTRAPFRPRGGLPGLRVLSRKSSIPASAKRCCHRQIVGRLTPSRWASC